MQELSTALEQLQAANTDRQQQELERQQSERRLQLALDATENALKEITARFQTVITNAPVVLWTLDRDGVFTFCEGKALESLEKKSGELVGQSVFEIYRDNPNILENVRRTLAGAEITWIGVIGGTIYANRTAPLRDENGQVTGLIGVSTEITERQRAEAALRESEQRLQAILDNSPTTVFLKDVQGRYLMVNRQCERDMSLTREQIMGKTDGELFPGANAEQYITNDTEVLATQTSLVREEQIQLDDGLHTRLVVKFPLFDAKGVPYALCGIATDITERKQAEQALQQLNEQLEERVRQRTASLQQLNEQLQNEIAEHRQTLNALRLSEERFRRAIVHAPIPIMIHAEDGEIFQINQVWTDITGYTQSDIPTIPDWTQRAYGERHEAMKAYIDQLYEGNTSFDDGEFVVTTRHGEMRIWDFCSAPLGQLPDGKRLAISMARDITERRRIETALAESERRLSELAKNLPGCIYQVVRHSDGSYSFPYMSPGSQRVFELEASEIEADSTPVVNLIHPDDRQSFEDSVAASAEMLDAWHWEGRLITPSGELKWMRGASCPRKQANGDVLWEQVIQRIFETGIEDSCEFSHVTPNGLRYYQSRYVPEFAADGRVESVLGIGRDITELKQAEETIRRREQEFRALVENAPDMIARFDRQLRYLYVNPAVERVTGIPPEECIGKTNRELNMPELILSNRERILQRILETGCEDVFEFSFVTPTGLRHFQSRYVPEFAADGTVESILGICRDITELKQAEEALRQSEERLRSLIHNMPVMMDAWDKNKTLIAWNRECERVTGYSAAEIVGNPRAFEMLYPDTDYLEGVMTQWQERGNEYRDWEWTLTSKDGQLKTTAWHNISESFPIQGWHGWAIGVDVTERKLAEAKMAQALQQERELNELKSDFIAIASHQFRTRLTTIFSSAELLERYRDRFSEEKQLTHLSRIQTSVQQMTVLLDDVLLVGKAGAGKLEFNPTPIDVVQFCEDLVEELQLSDKNQHVITFTHQGNCKKAVEGTTDMLPLLDEKYLRHIFDNLLSNAIKYSPDGGTVRFDLVCFCDRVKRSYSEERASALLRSPLALPLAKRGEAQASADRAVFQVQDEGIGIPQEDIPYLFETFQRARNVGTIQGTGLGLAIVKQCVDLHGGEILVESEVGSGTTFTVTLPLNYPHQSNNP